MGRITAPHAMSRVLMNQNLLILFVFLRFHSLEIDPLPIDVTLQFLPVAWNPEFAFVVEGEDVVIAVSVAHTTEIVLFVVFKIVPCDDVLEIQIGEAPGVIVGIELVGVTVDIIVCQ